MSARHSIAALWMAAVGALAAAPAMPAAQTPSLSIVSGVVVSDGPDARPVARAVVTLSGGALKVARTTVTDDAGAFEFRDVPAGSVSLTAAKHGFVTTAYGATSPTGSGTPLKLDGASVRVTCRLVRAAVVTGVITDPAGRAIPGAMVFAFDAHQAAASIQPVAAGRGGPMAFADDRGAYRLFDVPPGDYLIAATVGDFLAGSIEAPTSQQNDEALAALQHPSGPGPVSRPPMPIAKRAPTVEFFPGTPNRSQASIVTVGPGDERSGVNLALTPMTLSEVRGRVVAAGGAAIDAQGVSLQLVNPDTVSAIGIASARPLLADRPDADGRFRFTDVLPGRYLIAAAFRGADPGGRSGGSPAPVPMTPGVEPLYGWTQIDVVEGNSTETTIVLQPGIAVSGRVVTDDSIADPPDLAKIRFLPTPTTSELPIDMVLTRVKVGFFVQPDGHFDLGSLAPESFDLKVSPLAGPNWRVRSAMLDGHDLIDEPLVLRSGDSPKSIVVTLTAQHSELSGSLQTATGAPATEYTILAFPTDPSLWRPNARRIQIARPATDGTYAIRDLPEGEYRLSALTSVPANRLFEPSFLDATIALAVKVTVKDGGKTSRILRLKGK